MLNTLDLFAGIGGFSLGLERTGGFRTAAFCEWDKDPSAVLSRHWPNVKNYGDIRTLNKETLDADGITIDVITGGFPCQDVSTARTGSGQGLGASLEGERSGLWFEYLRLIRELRPQWVIIENVSVLLTRGLETVLRALMRSGMTRNGTVFLLPPLAPRTRETVSGLLPTPAARDSRDLSSKGTPYPSQLRRKSPSLATLLYKAGLTGLAIPETYEWAMGFPVGHTDLSSSGTP
jgi:hypothetical protein